MKITKEFEAQQRTNEKLFVDHRKNISNHDEMIRKMKEDINENKTLMQGNADNIAKISSKLERA